MITYALITVAIVFAIIAVVIFLALASRGVGSPAPPISAPAQVVSQKKWYIPTWEKAGWAGFTLVILDLLQKFVFPNVPVELKDWIPGFSWNTIEIIIAVVGVYFLWKRSKKTTTTGAVPGGGSAVGDVQHNHLSPAEMTGQLYGGVPQIRWIRTQGESIWIAASIIMVVVGLLGWFLYASGGMKIFLGFVNWAVHPVPLSRGAALILSMWAIAAIIPRNKRILLVNAAIFGTVVGCAAYGWGWFAVLPGNPWWMGVMVPAISLILPIIWLSLTELWRRSFNDWEIPVGFVFIWFFFVIVIQRLAV